MGDGPNAPVPKGDGFRDKFTADVAKSIRDGDPEKYALKATFQAFEKKPSIFTRVAGVVKVLSGALLSDEGKPMESEWYKTVLKGVPTRPTETPVVPKKPNASKAEIGQ